MLETETDILRLWQANSRVGWAGKRLGVEDEGYVEIALKLGSGLVKTPLYDGNEKLLHDVKKKCTLYLGFNEHVLNF